MIDYAAIQAEKPPKLQREWVDRLVRVRKDISTNGGMTFPKGLVVRVVGKYHGLSLQLPFKCPCCGVGQTYSMTGVEPAALDLLPLDTPEPQPVDVRPNPKPYHQTSEPCKSA